MKFTTLSWFWHNVKRSNRKRFHWRSWKLFLIGIFLEFKCILLTGKSLDALHDENRNDPPSKDAEIHYQKDYYL